MTDFWEDMLAKTEGMPSPNEMEVPGPEEDVPGLELPFLPKEGAEIPNPITGKTDTELGLEELPRYSYPNGGQLIVGLDMIMRLPPMADMPESISEELLLTKLKEARQRLIWFLDEYEGFGIYVALNGAMRVDYPDYELAMDCAVFTASMSQGQLAGPMGVIQASAHIMSTMATGNLLRIMTAAELITAAGSLYGPGPFISEEEVVNLTR